MSKQRLLKILKIILPIIILLLIAEVIFELWQPNIYSLGKNAMWVRHSWVGEDHTKEEYQDLVGLFHELQITDAYFHVGPLNSDGTVPKEKYLYAQKLVENIKKYSPNVRLYAWLGQVEAKAGGPLDLAKKDTLDSIVNTAEIFINIGFDGIHYDIEPIFSYDKNFLSLLEQTNLLLKDKTRDKILSVATSKPEPILGLGWILKSLGFKFPGYWKKDYMIEVSEKVDQIAIMSYDTAIPFPFLYKNLNSWIVRWTSKNIKSDIFIGIPTYGDLTGSHYPYVENVDNSLEGIKQGLVFVKQKNLGVAIYSEWTTSKEEIKMYRKEWLNK